MDAMLSFLLDKLILGAIIVAGDAAVFTFFHHRMTGKWWWEAPKQQDLYIRLTDDGWVIGGKGQNPLRSLMRYIDQMGSEGSQDQTQDSKSIFRRRRRRS